MNTRAFFRWTLSVVGAIGLLGVIGLALNPPVQARVNVVHNWPGAAPCNASLQVCITALPGGDVIHILPGTYTQSVTLNKPVSLIGDDPASTTLFADSFQRVLTVTGNLTASTVISGLTFRGGLLNGAVCPDACGGGILISGTARPMLQNIALVENTAWQGGGLWVDAGPEVVIVEAKIISNLAAHVGGGISSATNVRLINPWIERNHSSDNGGGLDVLGALNVTNGVILSNTASLGGGGARVAAEATLNLGRWEGNVANNFGGGLFASSLIMTGTLFINNEGNGYGGGAYVNGPVQIKDGRFERNRALGFGGAGGLYASELHASGTEFIGNTANGSSTAWGGGAYVAAGVSDLNLVRFENNSALGAAGGLFVGAPVTLTNATLINNLADMGNGGGVYAGGSLFIKDSRLENNFSRAGSGGGAYVQGSAAVANSVFVSNSALLRGGGLLAETGADLLRVEFLHNAGPQSGGGLDVSGPLNIASNIFIGNSSSIGGGVFHTASSDGRVVNSLFARNVGSASGASALHLASTGHVDVIHTTIADPAWVMPDFNPAPAIRIESGSLNITNTIIADHSIGVYNSDGTAYEDYNLFSSVGTIASGLVTPGGHDKYPATPQFANPLNDNYHLRPASEAIDNGTDAGVYLDIDGQPRPIGPGFDIGFDEAAMSIQKMIDSTPNGGTVIIPSGVYTESLTLNRPVSLVGVGIGSTIINAAPNDRVLTVTGNTILPTTQIVSLTLQGGRLGGTCQGLCNGGGVLITDGAYPSFQSVMINDNQAVLGGGLYIQSGGAQLFNSSVVGNQARQSGGGAYVEAANATLEQIGGAFGGNLAIDGAGVFVQEGQFKASGGVLYGNRATNFGGGLLVGSGGSIRTEFTQLISNSANNAGGALLLDIGQAVLQNTTIISSTAYQGGAIYVRDMTGTVASLVGGKVENNTALSYGGGIYAGGSLYITGTRFFGNTAYDGSALEITGTAKARLVNAFIAGNRASGAFPSTNSSVRFDSSGDSVVLHTTFGNATEVLTRALTVNSGVVTVANTIVASYTNGLSQFGGYLIEDYNLFFKTPLTFTGSISNGGHSLIGLDPLFKNPVTGDYHIKGVSPAVNKGLPVSVRRDIDLDARPLGGGFDIGADEASVAGTIPGPNIGGSFTYTTMQNSTINLNVPPGAVTQTTPIYCSLIEPSTVQPPQHLKFAGVLFELDAQLDPLNDSLPGSINFNVPVTVTVSYTDEELAAAGIRDETSMKLYRFEPAVNDWEPIGYRPGETQTLDVNNNLITATLLGFSRLGKMGATTGFEIFLPSVLR
jgi:predicted outer membrane repeat protein